jgi:ABC-2 type transport system permease protein
MNILKNNLQRLLKQKGLIFIFLFPIAFTAFYLMGSSDFQYTIGIVDDDKSFTSTWLVEGFDEASNLVYLDAYDETEIKNKILKNELDFVLVIPKAYEASLLDHQALEVESYYSEGNSAAVIPKNEIDGKISQLQSVLPYAEDSQTLTTMLKEFSEGHLAIEKRVVGENKRKQRISASGLGLLVMSMMLLAHSTGAKMNDDKENGIYQRIMASPLSKKRYNLEAMASLLTMVGLNIIVVMIVVSQILGGDFGPNPLNVLIVLFVFGTVAVAITNLINNISKNRRQASTISVMITTPLCMLGGCFWPIEVTPKVMQYISNFVPTKWVMQAISKTVAGGGLDTVLQEIVILLLFALAIFMVSSSKRIAYTK